MLKAEFQVDRFENDLALGGGGKQGAGDEVGQLVRVLELGEIFDDVIEGGAGGRGFAALGIHFQQLVQDGGGEAFFEPFGDEVENLFGESIDDDGVLAAGLEEAKAFEAERTLADGLGEFDAGEALEDDVGGAIGMGDGGADEAEAGDVGWGALGIAGLLHGHGEHAISGKGVMEHFAVARLVNEKGEHDLGEKDRVGESHDRDLFGQNHEYNLGESVGYSRRRWRLAKEWHGLHGRRLFSMKALIAILILVALGLSGSLYYRHNQATEREKEDTTTIYQLSNTVVNTQQELARQEKVNQQLESIVVDRTQQLLETSNTLVTVNATLVKVREEAKSAAETAAADLAKRDARINELETQRDDLTKRMTDLNGQITGLDGQIADMQRKLEASEGDREFLLQELRRLQDEKNSLERQFNDLAMLREQVRKLRDELSISRRLDWIRRGLYGSLKGAERLQQGIEPPITGGTNFDLNVELQESGEVEVVPQGTNAPAEPAPQEPQPE